MKIDEYCREKISNKLYKLIRVVFEKLTLFFGSRPGFKLSDASFHLAGDGQLAGIYEPHPQKVFKFHQELYDIQ